MNHMYKDSVSNEIKVYKVHLSGNLDFSLVLVYEVSNAKHYLIGQYLFYKNKQLTFNSAHTTLVQSIFDGFSKGYLSKVYSDELFEMKSRKINGVDVYSLQCMFVDEPVYLDHINASAIYSVWNKTLHSSGFNYVLFHGNPILESEKHTLSYEVFVNREREMQQVPGFYVANENIHISFQEKMTIIDFLEEDDIGEIDIENWAF